MTSSFWLWVFRPQAQNRTRREIELANSKLEIMNCGRVVLVRLRVRVPPAPQEHEANKRQKPQSCNRRPSAVPSPEYRTHKSRFSHTRHTGCQHVEPYHRHLECVVTHTFISYNFASDTAPPCTRPSTHPYGSNTCACPCHVHLVCTP